jgi:hypothetical protein
LKNNENSPSAADYPGESLRLIFAYEGSTVKLISKQNVRIKPPPSDPLEHKQGQSGFWYEVRDSHLKVLYRRIMNNPIRTDREFFDNETRSLSRQQINNPKGIFSVLIPAMPDATSIALFSSPLEQGLEMKWAQEFAVFDIRADTI